MLKCLHCYTNILYLRLLIVLLFKLYITSDNVAPSTKVNLLVFWAILPPDEGALHAHQTQHKAQHTQGESWHEEASHYLDIAWSRQKHTQILRKIYVSLELLITLLMGLSDNRCVTNLPQTRAQGSHNSCWQQWSPWNRISTGWTSTRPPWWWRSLPCLLLRWSSSPPWPWCRRWRSSPKPSSGSPKSGPHESSSWRSEFISVGG